MFELDLVHEEIRLPQQTPEDIRKEVRGWIGRKSCKQKELESLVGHLCHTSRIIKPWKTFMCSLFEVLSGSCWSYHHICLSSAIRLNILWWNSFIDGWNGVSSIPQSILQL